MKAIKIMNIRWNLNSVDSSKKNEVKNSLPTMMGFITKDDEYNVPENVPVKLKKKYGYDIIDFSFSICRVVDNFEDLLYLFNPEGKSRKPLFKVNNEPSLFGLDYIHKLKDIVIRRKEMEKKNIDESKMPKLFDEVMIGIERTLKLDWNETSVDTIINRIDEKVADKKAVNLEDEF